MKIILWLVHSLLNKMLINISNSHDKHPGPGPIFLLYFLVKFFLLRWRSFIVFPLRCHIVFHGSKTHIIRNIISCFVVYFLQCLDTWSQHAHHYPFFPYKVMFWLWTQQEASCNSLHFTFWPKNTLVDIDLEYNLN